MTNNDRERRPPCEGKNRAGEPCGARSMHGHRFCVYHINTARVQQEVRKRLLAAALPAFDTLIEICTDPNAQRKERIMAANSLLDRGAFGTKSTLVHETDENAVNTDSMTKEQILDRIDKLRQRISEQSTVLDFLPFEDGATSDGVH